MNRTSQRGLQQYKAVYFLLQSGDILLNDLGCCSDHLSVRFVPHRRRRWSYRRLIFVSRLTRPECDFVILNSNGVVNFANVVVVYVLSYC